ncbi:MAG: hypothetical protein ACK5N0_13765 [Synechococcaceae cyanobacterium]
MLSCRLKTIKLRLEAPTFLGLMQRILPVSAFGICQDKPLFSEVDSPAMLTLQESAG